MSEDRERNQYGQYQGHIPVEAALEVFDDRDDRARPLTATDVMEALECSRRTAHNKLQELVERGDLETRKIGARGRVWWVPLEGRVDTRATDAASRRGTDQTGNAHSDSRTEPPTTDHSFPPAVEAALETVDLPGSGATLEARKAALLAAYAYLTDNPSATKAEFLEHVYPDHPAGFETPEGWWNAIQPPLKELPGVDSPEERGHIWNYLGRDRFTPTLG